MKIKKNKVVSIDYELTSEDGNILDSTHNQEPLVYLHGANNILAALEKELEGKGIKGRLQTKIAPEDGYGIYDDQLVQKVPWADFPNADHIKEGAQFQVDTSEGAKIATITKVDDKYFILDLNHPLAGQVLCFDVNVVDIREATPEEIKNGHIHTEGCGCGHSH
jgi:FKBP-type peptidyl-prolyl cis-trans isomerase SlyD